MLIGVARTVCICVFVCAGGYVQYHDHDLFMMKHGTLLLGARFSSIEYCDLCASIYLLYVQVHAPRWPQSEQTS